MFGFFNRIASESTEMQIDSIEAPEIPPEFIEAFKTVYDPEIPVDIYELGLIYDVKQDESGKVWVKMTLTAPACPVAGTLVSTVEFALLQVDSVTDVEVELVWDPPWSKERMSEEARITLDMFD